MTDLEELFHDAGALAEQSAGPTGDTMGRLRRVSRSRRRRRRALLAVPVTAVLAVAIAVAPSALRHGGGSSLVPADGTASPGADPTTAAGGTCTYRPTATDNPTPRYAQKAVGREVGLPPADPGAVPTTATVHTNRGDVTVSLRAETACTVNSFTHLVQHGYYDDTSCFRLTTKGIYVLQCGDPSGTGSGGPGYTYGDEALPGTTYPAGTVAMANSGPDSNGSQFFLVYKDMELDPSYTVFGHITAGLDVLTAIAAGGSTPGADGHPNLPVTIQSVTLI